MDGISEGTQTEETVGESRSTALPSCLNVVPEMTSAELTPLDMTSVELAPLQSCNITTVEVRKDNTNVSMDDTLTNTAYPVYVKSLSEAEDVLHRFENETKNRYSVWRCPKDFGNSRKQCTIICLIPLVFYAAACQHKNVVLDAVA